MQTSNTLGFPLLSITVFLPAVGAVLIFLMPRGSRGLAFATGALVSAISFIASAIMLLLYRISPTGIGHTIAFQFADPPLAPAPLGGLPGGITYQLAVDGISVTLVALTTLLSLLAIVYSWSVVRERVREYVALLLLLETGMLGVFASMDLFLFYVFWEASLIPMYFLMGIWGGKGRVYATLKFFIYTLAGSALMLVAIVALVGFTDAKTFHLFDLLAHPVANGPLQMALFAAFALAFAVKVPLFPLHTWLPDAHVEAPTAGSVLLAGVLLKLGAYGFLRLAMPLFPAAAAAAAPWLVALAVIGIWYGAAVAFAQRDVKSLVAYSSVSHMGVVMLGLLAATPVGLAGGTLQMINHGISTGALFLLVGMLYERAHTRQISDLGGLWAVMPRYSVIFLVVMFSSIGLPTTNGFVGEWLSLAGSFATYPLASALATFGVVLGAAYMLWLFQRVFFGTATATVSGLRDLSRREMAVLAPLVILVFWLGLWPVVVLSPIESSSVSWSALIRHAMSLASLAK